MQKPKSYSILMLVLVSGVIGGCGKADDKAKTESKVSKEIPDKKVESADKESAAKDKTTKKTDIVAMFKDCIDAHNKPDIEKLVQLFDSNATWVNQAADKKVFRGRRALAQFLLQERKAFPDATVGLRRILVHGDELIVQGVFRGTFEKSIQKDKQTLSQVGYEFAYIVTTDGNVIVQNVVFLDFATALKQMGAVPAGEVVLPPMPGKPEVVRADPKPENVELVKQFYSLWESGNVGKLDQVAATGFTWKNHARVKSYGNLLETKAYLKTEYSKFDELKIDVRQMITVGPYVAVVFVQRGMVKIMMGGDTTPTVKAAKIAGLHLFKIEDSKLVECDFYHDEYQLYKEFGLTMLEALPYITQRTPPKASAESAKEAVIE